MRQAWRDRKLVALLTLYFVGTAGLALALAIGFYLGIDAVLRMLDARL